MAAATLQDFIRVLSTIQKDVSDDIDLAEVLGKLVSRFDTEGECPIDYDELIGQYSLEEGKSGNDELIEKLPTKDEMQEVDKILEKDKGEFDVSQRPKMNTTEKEEREAVIPKDDPFHARTLKKLSDETKRALKELSDETKKDVEQDEDMKNVNKTLEGFKY